MDQSITKVSDLEYRFTNIPDDDEVKQNVDKHGFCCIFEPMKNYLGRMQYLSAGKLHEIIMTTPEQFHYFWVQEYIKRKSGEPMEESDATRRGSALHTLVFEESLFDSKHLVYNAAERPEPEMTMASKKNKAWKDNIMAQALMKEKTVITFEEYEVLRMQRAKLLANDTAWNILNQPRIVELSIYFKLQWNGRIFYMKIRPDMIAMKKPFYADLKSTRNASPEINKFPSDCHSFGYHVKMALYYDGIAPIIGYLTKANGYDENKTLSQSIILAVESDEPYGVCVYSSGESEQVRYDQDGEPYQVDNDTNFISVGRYRYRAGLDLFAKCLESGNWPGYEIKSEEGNGGIIELTLPKWALGEIIV